MGDPGAAFDLLRRLALRTSARNQFIGRIVAVTARAVDAEAQIEIQSGQRITAGITNESVECLGLRPGRSVWALIKAVAVDIVREAGTDRPARSNALCGTVSRMTRGDGPTEVVIDLSAGVTVRGVVAADVLATRGIVEQGPACAIFPAAGVIVGVDH
jgi:molybdate transport system regulatory protein